MIAWQSLFMEIYKKIDHTNRDKLAYELSMDSEENLGWFDKESHRTDLAMRIYSLLPLEQDLSSARYNRNLCMVLADLTLTKESN